MGKKEARENKRSFDNFKMQLNLVFFFFPGWKLDSSCVDSGFTLCTYAATREF